MTGARRWRNFLGLLAFLRPFAGWVAVSVLVGAAATGAAVGLLGASAYLIALAALHPSVAVLQVAIVGVRFFGIARALLRYLERLVSHSVNFKLLARLRVWFYRAIEPLAPARLQDLRGGDLLARSVADIETLENFYVRAVAPPLSALVVITGVSLFAGGYHPALAGVLLLALLAGGVGLPLLAYLLARSPGRDVVRRRAELNGAAVEAAQGISDILLFGQERAHAARIAEGSRALSRAQIKLGAAGALANALSTLLTGLALCGVLLVGIPLVGSRVDGVMLAVLCLVTLASFEAVTPLPAAAQQLEASLEAAERLFSLAAQPPTVKPSERAVELPASLDLSIRSLVVRYDPAMPPALDGLDLDLPFGKRVALVGASGSGKTTVFNVLLRFWEWEAGEITLGGQDLRSLSPERLRETLAVMPQAAQLFTGTLRQNLALGAAGASDDAIRAAAAQAGLEEWIERLPEGLDTWVGERGLRISGGERQRVAAARALLRLAGHSHSHVISPSGRILLLDEPTAHLDPTAERRFLLNLQQLSAGHSLILITHRAAALDWLDEIVVLEQGRVIERGAPARLAERGGWYARMLRIQRELLAP